MLLRLLKRERVKHPAIWRVRASVGRLECRVQRELRVKVSCSVSSTGRVLHFKHLIPGSARQRRRKEERKAVFLFGRESPRSQQAEKENRLWKLYYVNSRNGTNRRDPFLNFDEWDLS